MQTRDAPPIRIGNGAGFWGDQIDAPLDLVRAGRLDVLTLEYLAELTLAILSHLRAKDPRAGFVSDLPDLLVRLVPELRIQQRLRIVTNGGGLNPRACAARCGEILAASEMGTRCIAVVDGDDVLSRIPEWIAAGIELANLETGEPIATVADRLLAAHVYLGAPLIAEALAGGAQLVLTGRVADASLALGPAAAWFGWSWTDWDVLAGGTAAGHLIECGAQVTGGLWEEWDQLPGLAGMGYPIAEIASDGSSVITKPEGSGGRVSPPIVAEQLLYEIGDPTCYRTPDVDVDFTAVQLIDQGPDRVSVTGARGRPPSDHLKLAAIFQDGWTASGLLAVVGAGAEKRARRAGAVILERLGRGGFAPEASLVECLGAGDVVGGVVRPVSPPFEVLLRVTVRDSSRAKVERFCRELAPLVTSGPPGIAGYAAGRPSPRPAFGYWPALVPRALVEPRLEIRPAADWTRETCGRPVQK